MRILSGTILFLVLIVGSTFASSDADRQPDRSPDLRWRARVVRVAVSNSLIRESPYIKTGSDVEGAVRRALRTWERAANLEFVETETDKQNVSASGAAGDGVSLITIAATAENVLLFAKDPTGVAATTRVFYDTKGQISEADIVLNPYQQFSTDGTIGTYDLESILTHEIGHLLGLGHSSVFGSTMHESSGKNGVYGMQNFLARTLSPLDVAAVRAIYGPPAGVSECCGRIAGKIVAGPRALRNAEVWLEDAASGLVVAQLDTSADGTFRFAGLRFGRYRIYSQSIGDDQAGFRTQELGDVEATSNDLQAALKRPVLSGPNVRIEYLGFNGQLSDVPVTLSSGRTFRVYLGGNFPDIQKMNVGTTSRFVSVAPDSLRSHDYGSDLDVISFEVTVKPGTPTGDYSLFVETDKGGRATLVGALSVDAFPNYFSTFTLSND
jgi:hypothetical protein